MHVRRSTHSKRGGQTGLPRRKHFWPAGQVRLVCQTECASSSGRNRCITAITSLAMAARSMRRPARCRSRASSRNDDPINRCASVGVRDCNLCRIGTCRGPLIDRVRFAADSSVEGTGFEPRACLNGCGARFLSDAKISTSANAPFYSDVYRWLAMRSGADG